jgi:predicted outer membrane protein
MKKTFFISACTLAAALAFSATSGSAQVPEKKDSVPVKKDSVPAVNPPAQEKRAELGAKPAGAISDSAIIAMLQVAHTQEIAAADLALSKSQSEQVKKFAEELKAEHGKALEELQQFADRMKNDQAGQGMPSGMVKDTATPRRDSAQAGRPDSAYAPPVKPPEVGVPNKPEVNPEGQPAKPEGQPGVSFENLSSLSGHEFDHGFVRLQVQEHEAQISKLRNDVIPMIKDSDLKVLVQRQLPVLGRHLTEARELEQHLKTIN